MQKVQLAVCFMQAENVQMKAIIRIPWDSGCYLILSVAIIRHRLLLAFQK